MHVEFSRLPSFMDPQRLELAIRRAFALGGRVTRGRVAVECVSSAEMQRLNYAWRGKNKPTDVLSFPQPTIPENRERFWGDVVIAPSIVRAEAKRRHINREEEMGRMTVHGVLHLLGFDHATENEELNMFALQEKIVETYYGENT